MRTYIAILEPGDGEYGVFFPDLPGCTSGGSTVEEATSNAAIALRLWAEDVDEMPKASSFHDLREDEDVREILDAGGVPFMVPLVTLGRRKRVNVMVDPGLLDAADEAAKIAGVSRSDFINSALRESLTDTIGAAVIERDQHGRR